MTINSASLNLVHITKNISKESHCNTHHLTEDDKTNRKLIFKVKSKGILGLRISNSEVILGPGISNSEQKALEFED